MQKSFFIQIIFEIHFFNCNFYYVLFLNNIYLCYMKCPIKSITLHRKMYNGPRLSRGCTILSSTASLSNGYNQTTFSVKCQITRKRFSYYIRISTYHFKTSIHSHSKITLYLLIDNNLISSLFFYFTKNLLHYNRTIFNYLITYYDS